jgi:hypothetical protein
VAVAAVPETGTVLMVVLPPVAEVLEQQVAVVLTQLQVLQTLEAVEAVTVAMARQVLQAVQV